MTDQEMMACDDLYRVLRRIAYHADQATAHEAAAALRVACQQGRVYGMSYGYQVQGYYIGCALGHLVNVVSADPSYETIMDVVGYPHAGSELEHYVMYVPLGVTPVDNLHVAHLAKWLTDYLDDDTN